MATDAALVARLRTLIETYDAEKIRCAEDAANAGLVLVGGLRELAALLDAAPPSDQCPRCGMSRNGNDICSHSFHSSRAALTETPE